MEIRESDIKVEFYRGSGPGGQHRNVTDSAVRIRHLPTGIVVHASESRSQARNREVAMQRLIETLERLERKAKKRIATKVSARERNKRLADKRRDAKRKSERRIVD
jgi:protein subunit release factor B